jgi:hypothetical protein
MVRQSDLSGISVAVGGFAAADLAIEAKENTLTLRGEKQTNDEKKSGDVLYQGIAARNFDVASNSPTMAHRPRARDPGGDEALGNPDREFQQGPGGPADQARRLTV